MILTAGDVFFYTTNNRVNTDSIISNNWITLSELRHIEPILTEDLYTVYLAAPSDYSDLDIYLKPAIAHFVLLDVFDKLHIQITDNGVYKITQQNNQTITEEERQVVKSSLKTDAIFWAKKLTAFLNDNYEDNELFDKENSIYNTISLTGGLMWSVS
jgi:hypothetical protein